MNSATTIDLPAREEANQPEKSGPLAGMSQARRELFLLIGIWVAVSAYMVWHALPAIREWAFPDPDDAMRLLEVRDWLAGQSWFDVTQYRLNPPVGGAMHWSRLVDLPIAAVVLLARPFLNQQGAETAALIAIPLLTLGVAMFLMHRIARRLMDPSAAYLPVIALPASMGALTQMRILRIDHHGWQIVLALLTLLAALDVRPRRSGAVAGLAMALWLNISIEGLPFTAAVGAWFGLCWLRDDRDSLRLRSFLAVLTCASALLFASMHLPSTWLDLPHDVLNVSHIAAFGAAWLGVSIGARMRSAALWARFAILGGAGAFALATMFGIDPHALQPPFASLGPMINTLWYDAVQEGQPVWHLSRSVAAQALAQPIVGIGGALFAIRRCAPEHRDRWIAFTWLLTASTATAVMVTRESTTASVLSLPGAAFLCEYALRRARNVSLMPARAVATAGALCIMAPAYALPAALTAPNKPLNNAVQTSDLCSTRSEVEKLKFLPPSNLAALLDITPPIIAMTPHRAIASNYHRNFTGLRDVILLFIQPPEDGRKIIARRNIDYVVFCPGASESSWWAAHGPNGLAARLDAGKPPKWLEPVKLPGLRALQVWRVRKALLASQQS